MARWWIIALGIGAAGLLLHRAAEARTPSRWTSEDAEYLARMLIMEHGRLGPSVEWVALGYVARNRAERSDAPIRDIVTSSRWVGTGARARSYLDAIQLPSGIDRRTQYHTNPTLHPNYSVALDTGRAILSDAVGNPIGSRRHFLHPQSLSRCDVVGEIGGTRGQLRCYRHPAAPDHGMRWYPVWAIDRDDGGEAEYSPVRIGAAIVV